MTESAKQVSGLAIRKGANLAHSLLTSPNLGKEGLRVMSRVGNEGLLKTDNRFTVDSSAVSGSRLFQLGVELARDVPNRNRRHVKPLLNYPAQRQVP